MNLAEATENARTMLEKFNRAPNRERKRRLKQALVQKANKLSTQQRYKDVVKTYRAFLDKMVLPPKAKPVSFRKQTIRKTEVLGLEVKKETEETQMTRVPSEITDESEKSLSVDAKSGLVGMGISSDQSKKTTFKIPKEKR
jgi:hypothetical protein